MTILEQKQFVVDVDYCSNEYHRIIVDQKYSQLKFFQKQLKQTFRQLPQNYYLLYSGKNGYISIRTQEDWETFYTFANETMILHICDNETSDILIPEKEFRESLLSILLPLDKPTETNKNFISLSYLQDILNDPLITNHFTSLKSLLKQHIDSHIISYEEETKYHMQFVSDITFPPTSPVQIQKNTQHLKVWKVRNNGNCQWPKELSLRQWNGNDLSPSQSSFPIPQIIRNNVIEIAYQFSLSTSGKYHIQCRLFTKENKPFGDILWLLCDVI